MSSRPFRRFVTLVAALALVVVASQASFADASARSYVVQPGDSLWRIATQNGVTVAELAAANGMAPSDILPIGRRLVIPTSVPVTTTSVTGTVGAAPGGFCAGFTPLAAPTGVLPPALAASPGRLALRPLFVQWADTYGVSPALLEAVAWQESGWQEAVVSGSGAVGIGQVLPGTARFVESALLGVTLDPASTSDNIRMTAAYLAWLSGQEGGSVCATVAAYYEGPGNMAAHGVLAGTEPYVADVEALLPRFE